MFLTRKLILSTDIFRATFYYFKKFSYLTLYLMLGYLMSLMLLNAYTTTVFFDEVIQ